MEARGLLELGNEGQEQRKFNEKKCCSELSQQSLSWMILYLCHLSSPACLRWLLFTTPKCIPTFENHIEVPERTCPVLQFFENKHRRRVSWLILGHLRTWIGFPIQFSDVEVSIGSQFENWTENQFEKQVRVWEPPNYGKKQDSLSSLPAQNELNWRPKII